MTGFRSLLSVLLAVATFATAVLAIGGTWMHHQLLNTDRWTTTAVVVLRDPAVQRSTAQFLADQTVTQLDDAHVSASLPPQLQALLGSGLKERVHETALTALRDRTLEPVWVAAGRSTHDQFTRWLRGADTRIEGDAVVLDLQPAVDKLARQVGVPSDLVRRAEAATGGANVRLIGANQYEQTRHDFLWLERLSTVMLPLAVACAVLSIAFARRRRAAVVRIGIAALAAGLVVLAATPLMRTSFENGLVDGGAARSVARAIWTEISPDLLREAWITSVIGGAVALLAFATRPGRGAMSAPHPEARETRIPAARA